MQEHKLIDQVAQIINDVETIPIEDKSSFNIFTILRNENEEVMLHSRFIYELLNPHGSHSMKEKYLKLFLRVLVNIAGVSLPQFSDAELMTTTVYRERFNIDLLLYLPDGFTIIIENKIDADDQSSQLERYYNTVINVCRRDKDKVRIIYLSNGREPKAKSIGRLSHEVTVITYASEIDCWLELCLDESKMYGVLYETIRQYHQLVNLISGKNDSLKGSIMKEISKFILKDEEALRSAINISKALNESKSVVISRFLSALEKEMLNEGYQKVSSSERESEAIENYYHAKEVIWQWYVLKAFSSEINFSFAYEITDRLYYYFAFTNEDGSEIIEKSVVKSKHPTIYSKCINAICKAHDIESIKRTTEASLFWEYLFDKSGKRYDFKKFSDNCISLNTNFESEAKRICQDVLPIIRRVEESL